MPEDVKPVANTHKVSHLESLKSVNQERVKKEKEEEEKNKKNPYDFTDDEKELYSGHDMDSPIIRAHSRMTRRTGAIIGRPITDPKETDTGVIQTFDHATAYLPKHNNDNQHVFFKDARGHIGHDSGL
jgi:hypothetical protein